MQYYKCSSAVLALDLTPGTMQVYHFLAAKADYKKRSCYYGVKTIAHRLKVSVSTVRRATKELVQKGLLMKETRFTARGKQNTNLYTLIDEPQTALERPVTPQKLHNINCHANAAESRVKGNALKVYTYMESHTMRKRSCTLSVQEIAQGCHLAVSTVRRALKVLNKAKLATRHALKIVASKWGKTHFDKNIFSLPKFNFTVNDTHPLPKMTPITNKSNIIFTGKEEKSISYVKNQGEIDRLIGIFMDEMNV